MMAKGNKTMIKRPTPEQMVALTEFAERYGRTWKSQLNKMWMDGYSRVEQQTGKTHLLQQVRNTFGPSWLKKFDEI